MDKQKYLKTIQELLQNAKIQNKDLADNLEITQPTLSNKLKGKRDFSIIEACKICKFFNKQFEEIFC